MIEKRDVVIVGGGLAGLTTAKFLAEKGIDVLILEEDNGFFGKPCGEGILPIGVEPTFFDIYGSEIGIEREIEEVMMKVGDKFINLEIRFLMMDKKKVEEELSKQVKKLGGEIRLKERVKRIEENTIFPQNVKAGIIVGADGARSMVRKSKGIESPKMGIAFEGYIKRLDEIERNKAYIWFGRDIVPHGYMWAFPKTDKWNVGIGSADIKNFKIYLDRFKMKFKDVENLRGACIPFSLPTKTYGKDFILVGDAASQIMTSIGAGNLTSMICGYIAAETLSKCLRRDSDLCEYEKAWKKSLGKLMQESFFVYRTARLLSRIDTNISRILIKTIARVLA